MRPYANTSIRYPQETHHQYITGELLKCVPAYKSCSNTEDAFLLLLAGETNPSARAGRGYTYSRLSLAILLDVDIIREKSGGWHTIAVILVYELETRTSICQLGKDMLIELAYQLREEGCIYLIINRSDLVEVRVSYFIDEFVALVRNDNCLVEVNCSCGCGKG
jgi:hypothetical protein